MNNRATEADKAQRLVTEAVKAQQNAAKARSEKTRREWLAKAEQLQAEANRAGRDAGLVGG